MDVTLAGSTLTRNWSDAELQGISIELSAFDGQIGSSTFPIPNPTGADEVPPGLSLVVEEGSTLLLSGIIVSEGRSRGFEPANPNKKDDYTVEDPNTFMFGFRVLADRPEETDYDRIQWFFDTYLPAADTTFVLNTFTTTMVAASYKSDGVADIMRDAIDITGKTLFLHDKAAGGLCAHWHALTGGHTCGLTIDDTAHVPDGPTTWYPQNPSRVKDGHDLTNDYLAYGADLVGPVSVSDGTSIATYDADGKSHQAFANFPAALDVATLTADAARLLETNKDPRDTWTCTIGPLDETALALIRVGDIITCTSTVMTLSASPQRIASLRLTVAGAQRVAPTLWMAELTLGAPVRGPGGRPSGMVRPPSTPVMPGVWAPFALDEDNTFTEQWDGYNSGDDCPGTVYNPVSTWTKLSELGSVYAVPGCVPLGGVARMGVTPFTPPLDPDYPSNDRYYLDFGGYFSGILHMTWYKNVPAGNPAPSAPVVRVRFASWPSGVGSGTGFYGLGGMATVSSLHLDYVGVVAGSPSFTSSGYDFYTGAFNLPITNWRQVVLDSIDGDAEHYYLGVNTAAMDADNANPPIGHPTSLIAAGPSDGVTTSYTTVSAYRPGSLEVIVGGLPWTSDGYVMTDPATGAFDFTQTPIAGVNPEDNLIEYRYVTA